MTKFIGYKYRIDGKRIIIYGVRKNRTEFHFVHMTPSMVRRGIKRPKLYTTDYGDLLKECLRIARDELIEIGLIDE